MIGTGDYQAARISVGGSSLYSGSDYNPSLMTDKKLSLLANRMFKVLIRGWIVTGELPEASALIPECQCVVGLTVLGKMHLAAHVYSYIHRNPGGRTIRVTSDRKTLEEEENETKEKIVISLLIAVGETQRLNKRASETNDVVDTTLAQAAGKKLASLKKLLVKADQAAGAELVLISKKTEAYSSYIGCLHSDPDDSDYKVRQRQSKINSLFPNGIPQSQPVVTPAPAAIEMVPVAPEADDGFELEMDVVEEAVEAELIEEVIEAPKADMVPAGVVIINGTVIPVNHSKGTARFWIEDGVADIFVFIREHNITIKTKNSSVTLPRGTNITFNTSGEYRSSLVSEQVTELAANYETDVVEEAVEAELIEEVIEAPETFTSVTALAPAAIAVAPETSTPAVAASHSVEQQPTTITIDTGNGLVTITINSSGIVITSSSKTVTFKHGSSIAISARDESGIISISPTSLDDVAGGPSVSAVIDPDQTATEPELGLLAPVSLTSKTRTGLARKHNSASKPVYPSLLTSISDSTASTITRLTLAIAASRSTINSKGARAPPLT